MTDKELWATFEKTGCVMDYLSYKGIYADDAQTGNKEVGEKTFEPENNSDRTSPVRDTYR